MLSERFKRLCEYGLSKNKNDEYYTLRETVEYVFEKVIGYDFLKNKIIYCPCDGEESEFVKYLKEKKYEINYKDFWYTSDDYNTHIDLIQQADLVITNPPFSKIRKEYFPLMKKYAKNYFFFHTTTTLDLYQNEDVFMYRSNYEIYKAGVGCTKDQVFVSTIFVSSFKCNQTFNHHFPKKKYNELYKDKEPVWAKIDDREKILCIDKITDIPIDYDGLMLVPITILYDYFKQHFDVTEISSRNTRFKFSDGKSRYTRILVKWNTNRS